MENFQQFVDRIALPCAVLSVEKTPQGGCGEIRILQGNRLYRETMGPAFYEGMLYSELVPKDIKFEDFCFRAAHLGQRMHAYVETRALNAWTDQHLLPLTGGDGRTGYCLFQFEFTRSCEPGRMAAVSMENAAAVIKACIQLVGTDDFRSSVAAVLRDILAHAGAEFCRILLLNPERRRAYSFCEVFRRGMEPPEDSPLDGEIPYEIAASWEKMIGVSNAVIAKDARDMENLEQRNPDWTRSLRAYGVRTLVLLPLRRGKTVIGYLYVVNFNVEKVVEVKELVELMSYFLGSEISNYLLMRRLEEMSNTDALTGIQNRNAMIQRLRRMAEEGNSQPFGIINLDLNGLKTVNDRDGHDAGDRLLVQAVEALKKVFYTEDLYRTGGDEFIAILTGISQEVFARKVARLRSSTEKNASVSFAIGTFWSDGSDDIHAAFTRADENMYADKKAFYALHPEKRRGAAG